MLEESRDKVERMLKQDNEYYNEMKINLQTKID